MKRKSIFFMALGFIYVNTSILLADDGVKLKNGCKFDAETGYKGTGVYIKGSEKFIIIDGGDSRYGTISTVYNGTNCKEITSGEKSKSNFSGLMKSKGFQETYLYSTSILDKYLRNRIVVSKDDDVINVEIEPIPENVSKELNDILSSISRDFGTFDISEASGYTKSFFADRGFYNTYLKKLKMTSYQNMNFNYVSRLQKEFENMLRNARASKRIILAKKKQMDKRVKSDLTGLAIGAGILMLGKAVVNGLKNSEPLNPEDVRRMEREREKRERKKEIERQINNNKQMCLADCEGKSKTHDKKFFGMSYSSPYSRCIKRCNKIH